MHPLVKLAYGAICKLMLVCGAVFKRQQPCAGHPSEWITGVKDQAVHVKLVAVQQSCSHAAALTTACALPLPPLMLLIAQPYTVHESQTAATRSEAMSAVK